MKAQQAIDHIKAGGKATVTTYTRAIMIDKDCLSRWEKAGIPLLKDDPDGRGLRMGSGKGYLYLFEGQLKLV